MFLQLAVVEEQVIPGQLRKEVAYSRHSTIPYTNLAKASGGPQDIFVSDLTIDSILAALFGGPPYILEEEEEEEGLYLRIENGGWYILRVGFIW